MRLLINTSICVLQCTKRMLCKAMTEAAFKAPSSMHVKKHRNFNLQSYINSESILNNKLKDPNETFEDKQWADARQELLDTFELTEINVDSQVFEVCHSHKRPDEALKYFKFLEKNNYKLSLGILGKYLESFYLKKNSITAEDEQEILRVYDDLRKKYPLLDAKISSSCILALSLTKCWKEAIELLNMLKLTDRPSVQVMTAVICAAFKNKDANTGWKFMYEEIQRVGIHYLIYQEHLNYCKTLVETSSQQKEIEKLFLFWREFSIQPSESVVKEYSSFYQTFGYIGNFTNVSKRGNCSSCKTLLQETTLTNAEFKLLSTAILKNVIIGQNLFCSTSPQELKRYLLFIQTMKPYDLVIDGLNVAYATKRQNYGSLENILSVINSFGTEKKRILVIGRAHMHWWNKEVMRKIQMKADVHLVKNISQDDPFLLHVTLTSGPQTYFVSRDLMRGHKFLLDINLQQLFKRWQLSRQYLYTVNAAKSSIRLLPPIPFDTTVQQNNNGWHIPYTHSLELKIPDLYTQPDNWLCLKKKS